MKKNEILSFADKWMKLKNIILSEVSQAQKTWITRQGESTYGRYRNR
jgi:hypothetical protein